MVVHQLYIDFQKAYDSIDHQKQYNIMIEQEIPKKLVNLVRMCMNETYDKVRIGKHLSEKSQVRAGLKQGDSLSPILFNLALEYVIKSVINTEEGLTLGGEIPVFGYAEDVVLDDDKEAIEINIITLINSSKELGLEISVDKTKYMVSS
ncbi:uncharacterized protein [Halyomorpha halys]|uniref:uncharacterized protein n=1 Tax=Halyomorpha halys TaxID=286706 RepID=UPI0034D36D24